MVGLSDTPTIEADNASRLDEIVRLLKDLLILQGLKSKMSLNEIRDLVQVDKRRVNKISKILRKHEVTSSASEK